MQLLPGRILTDNNTRLEDGVVIQPVEYFQNFSALKIQQGDYELLAPGVLRVILDQEPTIFRHVSIFHPLTMANDSSTPGLGDSWDIVDTPEGIEQVLAVILAAHHFNNRIPTDLVPDMMQPWSECNIKLTLDVFDTRWMATYATRQLLLDVLPRYNETSILQTIVPQRRNVTNVDDELRKYPTAILGGYLSATSSMMAIIGGVWNLTQVSSFSAADSLDNKDTFPFFGRVVSPASGISKAGVEFFTQRLQASHVFIIYVRDMIGTSLFRSFKLHATQLGLETRSASISSDNDIDNVLDELHASGYRYVYTILHTEEYRIMLPRALERGLAGTGTFWMYVDTFSFPAQPPGDPLLEASHGSAVIGLPTGSLLRGYRTFENEWKQHIATAETQAFLDRILPQNVTENPRYAYKIPALPSGEAMFNYDAFMSLANSACDASKAEGDLFSTSTLHHYFFNQNFTGATGIVELDNLTGSRLAETIEFVVSNLLVDSIPNAEGMITLEKTESFIFQSTDNGAMNPTWRPLTNASFIYSDNTTNPPLNLPLLTPTIEEIQVWATVLGCIAFTLVTCITAGFCVWMQRNVKTGPILAAQPFFMRMVASGVVLMSLSLVPLAFLPYVSQPDVACMMGPWFLFVGFCVTYAAIFSKLRRINQIESSSVQMKRVTITPIQVLTVFAILLTLNLSILIAWTVVSPLKYLEVPTASRDGYGRVEYFLVTCEADNSREASYFYLALGILNLAAIMVCWYESYKVRNSKVAYNENKHVIMALVISSQSFLVGAPLVIAADNPSARYFCNILAVTWGCLGILCPIMAPKVLQVRRWKVEKATKEANQRARIERVNAYFANVAATAEAPIPTVSTMVSRSTADMQLPQQAIALSDANSEIAGLAPAVATTS